MSFKDHFSGHAGDYALHRPGYPDTLFTWLAEQSTDHDLAWDCATGSGQVALGLARHFARVVATDASLSQIEAAAPHPRIEYRVAPAEAAPFEDGTVDLVTVAQALHWFDFPRFFSEVHRVLKPGGLLAAWAYGMMSIHPDLDPILDHFYRETVGPYWPPEREHIESGYRTIPFPDEGFADLDAPSLSLELEWSLAQVLDYLATWSATKRCIAATGIDPIEPLRKDLARYGLQEARAVTWPLSLRALRKSETRH